MREKTIQRRDIHFAALLSVCLATGNLAAQSGAKLPAPGSTTNDGFTVSAQWHVHYTFKNVLHGKYQIDAAFLSGGRLRKGDPFDSSSTTTGDANVSEEVNKQTAQQRAVVETGDWHWQKHYQDPSGSVTHSASGAFQSPVISHWWDAQAGEAMVGFSINPTEPANYARAGPPLAIPTIESWKSSLPGIPTMECRVPFHTKNLVYREIQMGWDGTWESELIITRTEQKLEAEIKPADGFKDWVPTMTGAIPFEVRLVNPPDLPVQWKVSLYKTSNLPGVCNNANLDDFPDTAAQWQNQIKKDSYDLIFDFRKYGKTDPSFKPVDEPWQVIETSKPVHGFAFLVNCLDYGASGRVIALAEYEGQVIAARYKETGETFVRIPYATNKNDSHRVAQAAKPSGSEQTYDQFSGGNPDADDDDYPEGRQTCKGDGLTLFEEYRGFFVRSSFDPYAANVHRRLNPQFKDVFIFMDDDTAHDLSRFLTDFQKASGLSVHYVGDDLRDIFVNPVTRIVNFNRGDIGSDQHAIRLVNFPLAEDGVLGECAPNLGPPARVNSVCVAVDKINEIVRRERGNFRDYLKQVVIHELGHAVGIEHHGYIDKYHDPKYGVVALEGGQHSGDIECAMRYVGADFYLHHGSTGEPNPKYRRYENSSEYLGMSFCSSPKGTGLNDKSKREWYCGDTDTGNCKVQIVVNDKCAGSGGGTQDRTGSGGGSAASSPDDPAEKSARQSQSQARVSARLTVSGKRNLAVIPGEAVVFDLRLAGLSNASLELGKPGEPWPRQVSFQMLDPNKKLVPLPASVRRAGKAMQLNPSAGKDGGPPPGEMMPSPDQIKITPESFHRAAFALDTSEMAKLPAGVLRIFAEINGRLTSTSVSLAVRNLNELSADEQARADAIRVLSRAKLAYAEEKFADAEQLAREAAAKMPDSVEAYLILARSLERQKKLRKAYDAYGTALEQTKPPTGKTSEPPLEIIFAMRWLREQLGIEPEPPPVAVGPLAAHSLFAESTGSRLNPPFPSHPDQLIFQWQLDKASKDPLGVRWIAADTSGSAPPDHLIAASKSDSGKAEGRFTLKSPTAGFPPGQYRIEIWQAGKMIYSEKFEIKRE